MSRSNEALVNDIFNDVAHLLSNVGNLQWAPPGSVKTNGFTRYSKMFCDSIVFWGLDNHKMKDTQGTAIGKYIAELRHAFSQSSLDVESIKMTHCGRLDIQDGYEYFTKSACKRHRKEYDGQQYEAGYIAVKVSLNYCRAKKVVPMLASMLPTLEEHSIVLHDIDITHDCRRITTRTQLERHIHENNAGKIVDDRFKVGDHCVSWRGNKENTKDIRFKVYNKFVQTLESAEVRKSLGSRMEDLVEKEGAFARHVKRFKEHGYTRVELTFYGSTLHSFWDYQDRMNEVRELLETCPTYKCSFENQWKQRAECIKSMVAVYFPKNNLFAYCHWWNSITSKKYGYMWKKVSSTVVPLLLANYSFNDRPIHYFEAGEGVNGKAVITKEKKYYRKPGCTAITLVPGPQKGMFPSRDECPNGARKFHHVGIVEVDNIKISWPKRSHRRVSAPLAEIIEREDDESETDVQRLKAVRSSLYTVAHQILQPDTLYTIVAAGLHEYRGDLRWHFISECGLKFRSGKSLAKIWGEWRITHLEGPKRIRSVVGVPFMTFRAVRCVRSRGTDDVRCELA